MKLRSTTAAAVLAIGAMTIGLGSAYAEPAAPAADPGVNYSVKLVDKTVVATLKGGTFSLTEQDGATPESPKTQIANVKDAKGATLVSFPLDYKITGTDVPVKAVAKNDGAVLEITPEKPANLQIVNQPLQVKEIASPVENQRAQNEFASKFGIATAVGGFVGTAVGAIIGCVVTFIAGCIPGLLTGAGVGGILGTIAAGGPTLVAAGIELLNTLQAPDGTTQWADKPAGQN
ncbi:hypothetical protein [Nocardia arthritidis]|uniref:DUF8020 domain-containing protein n=1 Tax=Nocardia arthritidis TaxID=228602 RepID=A0A6G9YT56_9NOCA|nr:hypothetical protein [Nocardia arthritidis]QIS16398.1 hypothetical protein F5544_42950 [Nocardia arthritidis]